MSDVDPRIVKGALALVAVAAFAAAALVGDSDISNGLQGLGWMIAGWVGLKRPGDDAPLPKRDIDGDGY